LAGTPLRKVVMGERHRWGCVEDLPQAEGCETPKARRPKQGHKEPQKNRKKKEERKARENKKPKKRKQKTGEKTDLNPRRRK
jgi:hypothetical protein